MNWAIWSGAVVLLVAAGGLLYLRERPLDDVDRSQLVRAVLTELLDAEHAPRSASELRGRLQLTGTVFYALMTDMIRAGLVQVRVRDATRTVPSELFWTYRLTDRGLGQALRRPTNG